jgi:hypothetical protein
VHNAVFAASIHSILDYFNKLSIIFAIFKFLFLESSQKNEGPNNIFDARGGALYVPTGSTNYKEGICIENCMEASKQKLPLGVGLPG